MVVYRNDLNKFYKRTVDIIYAFIIGQSFLQLDSLLTPVSNLFEYHRIVDEAALFLASPTILSISLGGNDDSLFTSSFIRSFEITLISDN
jgi:hypothetical protein